MAVVELMQLIRDEDITSAEMNTDTKWKESMVKSLLMLRIIKLKIFTIHSSNTSTARQMQTLRQNGQNRCDVRQNG